MRVLLLAVAAAALSVAIVAPSQAQSAKDAKKSPPEPAPRNAAGRVLLGGATPQDKGVWVPAHIIVTPLIPLKDIPFQPWAKAQWDSRQVTRMEPHTRCKPSGSARQFITPYGVEMDEFKQLKRIYIFDIGGPHTFRVVYMDGRSHPKNFDPTYYGHSIGWWDGDDTLVIDTVGYNEGFWPDRMGLPHTTRLHTVERLTRLNATNMKYQITFDDPGAYTKSWTASFGLRWEAGTELYEYVCQDANEAGQLLVGQGGDKKLHRISRITP